MPRRRLLALAVSAMCVVVPISEASAKRSFGSRALERPMRGADVRILQGLLSVWGTPLTADGQFGRLIFGFAVTEALGIFSLLVALLLIFAV